MARIPTLLLSLFAFALIACGGGDDSAAKGQDAPQILQRSAGEVAKLTTFHFRLDHENGSTPLPLNLPISIQLVSAEGDVAVPDRLSADVKAKAASISANVKVIGVGDKTWMTNFFSGSWQQLPGASIKDVADPAALVSAIVGQLSDVTIDGMDKVDGVESYRLTGKIDAGALALALPTAEAGRSLDVQVWIGVDDALPRRARIRGAMAEGESSDIVRQIDLSKFGVPVTIQPPA